MKYFSVPADFKKETIDEYEKLQQKYPGSRVLETYGNITSGENLGSGRVIGQLPRVDLLDLREYIRYSAAKGIDFNYTFNISYIGNKEFTAQGTAEIKKTLQHLYQAGVRSLTVAMPSLIEIVASAGYEFKIKASTICHITNANKAAAYKRMGVYKIVVDESVHRDFQTLKAIRDTFGDQVELIVNTMCHRNCIYRHFHYNQVGGESVEGSNDVGTHYFENKCLLQRYRETGELLRLAWIRPEDLRYYIAAGIHYFKLQGRQHVAKGGHIKTLEHYFKEDFDGNLMDLLDMFNSRYSFKVFLDNKKLDGFIKPFVEQPHFCKNNCTDCKYCQSFAPKCIDLHKAGEVTAAAKKFYDECDPFRDIINATQVEIPAKTGPAAADIDFELD